MRVLADWLTALFAPRVEHHPDPRTLLVARWCWRERKNRHKRELEARLERYARRWPGATETKQVLRWKVEPR